MLIRHPLRWVRLIAAVLLAGLAACGGGGGSGDASSGGSSGGGNVPPPAPITKVEAFRFLNQSTYGATEADVQRLVGTYLTQPNRVVIDRVPAAMAAAKQPAAAAKKE